MEVAASAHRFHTVRSHRHNPLTIQGKQLAVPRELHSREAAVQKSREAPLKKAAATNPLVALAH
jgi:hypothetical protein